VTKSLWHDDRPLLLASTSKTRLKLLQDISLPVETQGADVDERNIETGLQKDGADPVQVALALARAKAFDVAQKNPGRWIVGADQTLALGAEQFHKPSSIEGARNHLQRLRGKTHQLHSAIVCVNGGREVFAHVESAHLTMRNFGDDFLEAYLAAAGSVVMQSVGAYQLEGLGIHLFDKVEGDHSTILGLPLLPLLAFFRQAGLVEA
jgi:septum formation protein